MPDESERNPLPCPRCGGVVVMDADFIESEENEIWWMWMCTNPDCASHFQEDDLTA